MKPSFDSIKHTYTRFQVQYSNEEFIIRQYAKGDSFYIISKGRAIVKCSPSKWEKAVFVKYLEKGDYFGEDSLIE